MAMNIGGKSVHATINMTPMIDILLVLLIIFIAIAPTPSSGLNAAVPRPTPTPGEPETFAPVVLEIDAAGAYCINSQAVDHEAFASRLIAIFERRADRVLFLKANPDLEFATIAEAIDTAHAASVTRVALMPQATK
jgi:biopolymer transport protein ExbD